MKPIFMIGLMFHLVFIQTQSMSASCDTLKILGDLESFLATSKASKEIQAIERQIEKLRVDRDADQPRWFEELRFFEFNLREHIIRGNDSAAVSLARLPAMEVHRSVAIIERINIEMPRIQELLNSAANEGPLRPELIEKFQNIAELVRELSPGTQINTPTTAAEAKQFSQIGLNVLIELRSQAEVSLGTNIDLRWRTFKVLEQFAKSTSGRAAESRSKDTAKRIDDAISYDQFVTSYPELARLSTARDMHSEYNAYKSSPIATRARAEMIRDLEAASFATSAFVRTITAQNQNLSLLVTKFIPSWGPVFKILSKLAYNQLYFKVHFPIIDQILPLRGKQPSAEEVYTFLVEKSGSHGFPLLVTFFRANFTTNWPQKLVDHSAKKVTREGESISKILEKARNAAIRLGPLPTYDRNFSSTEKIQLGSELLIAIAGVLAGSFGIYTGLSAGLDYIDPDGQLKLSEFKRILENTPSEIEEVEKAAEAGDNDAKLVLDLIRSNALPTIK